MDYVHQYVPLDEVKSADLNAIQQRAASLAQLGGTWAGGFGRPYLQTVDGSTSNLQIGGFTGMFAPVAPGTAQGALLPLPLSDQPQGYSIFVPTSLTGHTWYYVYAFNNGGYVGYTTSPTAPDDSLSFMHGDYTKRYVGCFRTDGNSAIIPFDMRGGLYLYRSSAIASLVPSPILRVHNAINSPNGTLTTFVLSPGANPALASLIAPTSRRALVHLVLEFDATASYQSAFVGLVTAGDSFTLSSSGPQLPPTTVPTVWWVPKGAAEPTAGSRTATTGVRADAEIETDLAQRLAHFIENDDPGGMVPKLTLWVTGFRE